MTVWIIILGAIALFCLAVFLTDEIIRRRRAARMVKVLTAAPDGSLTHRELQVSLEMSALDKQIEAYRVDADGGRVLTTTGILMPRAELRFGLVRNLVDRHFFQVAQALVDHWGEDLHSGQSKPVVADQLGVLRARAYIALARAERAGKSTTARQSAEAEAAALFGEMADIRLRSIRAELQDGDVEAAYELGGELLKLCTMHMPPSMVDTRFLDIGAVLWLELAGRTEEAKSLVRRALDLMETIPDPDRSDQIEMQNFRDWLAKNGG